MKKIASFILLVVCCVISFGCTTYPVLTIEESTCYSEAAFISPSTLADTYKEYCQTNFINRQEKYREFLKKSPALHLCQHARYSSIVEASEEIQRRKINCTNILAVEEKRQQAIRREQIKQEVKNASVSNLCMMWYQRVQDAYTMGLVETEVKRRKVNCVTVVQTQQQLEMQQEAQAQEAEFQRQQAWRNLSMQLQQQQLIQQQNNLMQQQIMQSQTRRMTTTNCNRFGNTVSCNSW
ncbi:MAG TPA: hypothetical protein VGF14_04690 [Alphaproteobacteria bacterium]